MTKRCSSVRFPSAPTRREILQVGTIGLLGLGTAKVAALRELADPAGESPTGPAMMSSTPPRTENA